METGIIREANASEEIKYTYKLKELRVMYLLTQIFAFVAQGSKVCYRYSFDATWSENVNAVLPVAIRFIIFQTLFTIMRKIKFKNQSQLTIAALVLFNVISFVAFFAIQEDFIARTNEKTIKYDYGPPLVIVQIYTMFLTDIPWWKCSLNFYLVWSLHYLRLHFLSSGKIRVY